MPRCLKSWKGCNGGDWQSIASFLGTGRDTGRDTQFEKQEAALHYSQTLLGSCGSDAVAIFIAISGIGC